MVLPAPLWDRSTTLRKWSVSWVAIPISSPGVGLGVIANCSESEGFSATETFRTTAIPKPVIPTEGRNLRIHAVVKGS